MKRFYATLALIGALITGAQAQRSVDMQIISNVSTGDTITIDSVNMVSYLFQTGFTNLGTDPLLEGDTVIWIKPYSQSASYYVILDTDAPFAMGDTICCFTDTVQLTNGPASGNANWCDSIWAISGSTNVADVITDPNPAKSCVTVYIQNRNKATGINDVNFTKVSLNIFPNPASSQLSFTNEFKASATAVVKITDIAGRTVKTINLGKQNAGTRTYNVDVAELNNGMYYIELTTDDTRSISKFTKN